MGEWAKNRSVRWHEPLEAKENLILEQRHDGNGAHSIGEEGLSLTLFLLPLMSRQTDAQKQADEASQRSNQDCYLHTRNC